MDDKNNILPLSEAFVVFTSEENKKIKRKSAIIERNLTKMKRLCSDLEYRLIENERECNQLKNNVITANNQYRLEHIKRCKIENENRELDFDNQSLRNTITNFKKIIDSQLLVKINNDDIEIECYGYKIPLKLCNTNEIIIECYSCMEKNVNGLIYKCNHAICNYCFLKCKQFNLIEKCGVCRRKIYYENENTLNQEFLLDSF